MAKALFVCSLVLASSLLLSGQIILQPPASQPTGTTAVTIQAGNANTGHLLDIICPGISDPCFKFEPDGTFAFSGNTAEYGSAGQSSASHVDLHGGTPAEAYLREYSASVPAPSAAPGTGIDGTCSGLQTCTGQWKVYAKVTYVTDTGETTVSPETNQITLNSQRLIINSPSLPPSLAGIVTGWRPYVTGNNGAQNSETLQPVSGNCTLNGAGTACAINQNWTEPTSAFVTGSNPPPTNTTGGQFSGYWFISGTLNGIPCFSASVPGADCTGGTNTTILMKNPMTAFGDLVYGGTPDTLGQAPPTRLAANNAQNTNKFLTEAADTNGITQTPTWSTIAKTDLPAATVFATSSTNGRQLVAGQSMSLTDNGSGSTLVMDLSSTCEVASQTDSITAATSFATTCTIPHDVLTVSGGKGSVIEVYAAGNWSSGATAGPVGGFSVSLGTPTILPAGQCLTLATSQTNQGWILNGRLVMLSAGASGTAMAEGSYFFYSSGGTNLGQRAMVNSGGTAGTPPTVSVNTTTDLTLSISETCTPVSNQVFNLTQLVISVRK